MIYYLIVSFLAIGRFISGSYRLLNSFLFYGSCLFLFAFVGFRYQVGCDWFSYIHYANSADPDLSTALEQRDPLFHALVYIVHASGFDFYPAINVICAAVFFAGVVALGRPLQDKLSFLLYLFPVAIVTLAMSGLRQAIATGILMLALKALIDRRIRTFLLLVLIASGFHGSAFVFIIIWPLITPMRSQAKVALVLLLSVPAALLFFSSDTVDTAIDRYTNTSYDSSGTMYRLGLLAIGSVAYFAIFRKDWWKLHPSSAFLGDFSAKATFGLIVLGLVPFIGTSSVILDRFGLYLAAPIALSLAAGPYFSLPPNKRGLFIGVFNVTYVLFFILWSLYGNKFYGCYEPYQSYLIG